MELDDQELRLDDSMDQPQEVEADRPSTRKCYDWLRSYQEYTEDWEPPAIFNKWVGLFTLSAATQRRVWLEEANNKIYPNLFVVLVAHSGVGKTTSMREAKPFIEAAVGAKHLSPAKVTAAEFAQRFAAAMCMDEKLGITSPYMIWAEEFPSFLGQDAYKSGMIADLTTLYDCPDRWEKATKTNGTDDITQPYLGLLGGTTAQGLFDVLPPGAVTQGFTARVIFVHASYNANRVTEKPWTVKKHQRLHAALLHDIKVIAKLSGGMKFSDYARTLWTDYYMYRPQADEEFQDVRLQGYAARKPFYIKKLALLLSISESDRLVIESHHVEKAFALLAEIDSTIKNVYQEIAPSAVIQHYSKILRKLRNAPGGRVSREDLQRCFSYSLDAREFTQVMEALAEMGLVELEYVNITSGRPKRYYCVTEGGRKWSI